MGLIHLPRAYFNGYTYWNPSTFNNNDYQPTYDAADARLNWPWLERHGVHSDAEIDRYAVQRGIIPTPNEVEIPQESPNYPPAEWNYYGNNTCGFVGPDEPIIEGPENFSKPAVSTVVTGFTDESGAYVDKNDPWIGLPLRMNSGTVAAKLVDVDPVCVWSSQIFVDRFSLGAAAGSGFVGETAGRAHSRWFYLGRNLNQDERVFIAGRFAAVFQIGLPTASITFFDAQPPARSAAAQLHAALCRPGIQGILVRFTCYLTLYFQGAAFKDVAPPETFSVMTKLYRDYAAELERYQTGARAAPPPQPINRAYSKTVGWIGPWADGELRSMSGGRLLLQPTPVAPLQSGLSKVPLGPAAVEYAVDPQTDNVTRLAIDLASTIPELDSTATKVDFGTMHVGLVPLDGSGTPLGLATIPYSGGYDKPAYERTAGVVDIPAARLEARVTARELQNNLLALWFDPSQPALVEAPFVAQTEQRGVYVDEPDAPWATTPDWYPIAVQVRHLGGKPPAGTLLCVAQYSPSASFRPLGWSVVSQDPGNAAQSPYVELRGEVVGRGMVGRGDGYIVVPVPHVDDGKPFTMVQVAVKAIRPGFPIIAFYPLAPNAPVSPPPASVMGDAWCRAFYCVVRVLPFRNGTAEEFHEWLKTGPTADLVTQRVFDEVFRTYFLMFPVMRFIKDPLAFQAWRGRILETTDPRLFETAGFMPVTRELSAGQRRMLVLWNSYLNGEIPAFDAAARLGPRRA
jgi:hypothetical protein